MQIMKVVFLDDIRRRIFTSLHFKPIAFILSLNLLDKTFLWIRELSSLLEGVCLNNKTAISAREAAVTCETRQIECAIATKSAISRQFVYFPFCKSGGRISINSELKRLKAGGEVLKSRLPPINVWLLSSLPCLHFYFFNHYVLWRINCALTRLFNQSLQQGKASYSRPPRNSVLKKNNILLLILL